MDYLRERFEPEEEGNLRPDQIAANKRNKQGSEVPGLIGAAAKTGLGAAAIGAVPQVIGSLFQDKEEPQNLQQDKQAALQGYNQKRKQPGLVEQETQRFNEGYPQAAQQQQVNDPLGLALMSGDIHSIMKEMNVNEKQAQRYLYNFQQKQGGQSQANQQGGANVDQALLAALDKILKM